MYTCEISILIITITNCVTINGAPEESERVSRFQVEYEWSLINFVWESNQHYRDAIMEEKYIPENNAMAGIKFYRNKFYIAMPRIRDGTPVTLGYITVDQNTPEMNPPITPFPNWEANNLTGDCTKLESVQSVEIDAGGIMWVIDGHRTRPNAQCPPKLVLYDLNNNSNIIHTFTFPENICLSKGGFLNDIVVDDQDGGYAYITDHSPIDPGLIVYSRSKNRAWKLRDASMFAEKNSVGFVVDNLPFSVLAPIDGIALSPRNDNGVSRTLYFCALAGLNLYSITTDLLKDENIVSSGNWRFNVTLIGEKPAQTDGMVVDNKGNLFYGLLPLYGVGQWNTKEDFSKSRIVDQNNKTMIWTDSFAFDDKGNLYLLANHIHRYFNSQYKLELTDEIKFRILKLFTSAKSYLY